MTTSWTTQPSTASGFNNDGPLQLIDNVVFIERYQDLAAAITDIGSTVTTLVINQNVNVAANATVPSTCTLWFMGQGKFTVSVAVTCTINGPIVAAPRQIFAGSGTVAGLGGCLAVDPFWWGTVSNDTLNLYVSTTGSDSNDGMTSGTALATVQAAGNKLYTFAYADITYKINIAAGTYTASTTFTRAFPTPNRVQFLGAAVADGTVPTTIFDSPGGSGQYGLYFQNYAYVYVEDIKFTDYRDGGSVAYSGGSRGLVVDDHSDAYVRNLHVSGCDAGIHCDGISQIRIQAGIIQSNAINVTAIANSKYAIGYGGSAADITGVTGTALLSSTHGLRVQEGAYGQATYTYFGSNTAGAFINSQCRLRASGCTFASNTTGVLLVTNAVYYDDETTPNTYTGNTVNVEQKAGGVRFGVVDQSELWGPSLKDVNTLGGSTQSATPVSVYTYDFAANQLQVQGAHFKLSIYGEVVGTADAKTIVVTLGATTLLTATIAASTTDYRIEVHVFNRTAATTKRVWSKVEQNGVTPIIALNVSANIDVTSAQTLTVTHQVTNVADLNRIGAVELEVVH